MKKVGFLEKWFMTVVCLMMLVQQQHACAQALPAPVANFVVNRAVAGVITRVAISRGFAANDARIAATMAGVSSGMTAVNVASTVGGVALAVAGAPVWLTVLGGLGILAAGAALVAGTTSIKIDNGAVTVNGAAPPLATYTPPGSNGSADSLGNPTGPTGNPIIDALLRDGTKIYRGAGCQAPNACMQFPVPPSNWVVQRTKLCDAECAGGPYVALYFSEKEFIDHVFDGSYWQAPRNGDGTGMTFRNTNVWEPGEPSNRIVNSNGTVTLGGWYVYTSDCKIWNGSSGSPCDPGYYNHYRATYWTSNYSAVVTVRDVGSSQPASQQYSTLDSAVAGLSAADKANQLSSDVLARVVDSAWAKAAAQPGYQGLPYSATQPVTAADAAAWQAENPSAAPTLGDVLLPASLPGVSTVPVSTTVSVSQLPSTNPGTGGTTDPAPAGIQNVNVVNVPTVRVEWGADPAVGTPSLEQTPTASSIVSPLLNLMPSLRTFVVPSHNSVCPKPAFSIFGRQIVMATHCAVLDDVKPTLYAVMAFVWLMLGALIILRA